MRISRCSKHPMGKNKLSTFRCMMPVMWGWKEKLQFSSLESYPQKTFNVFNNISENVAVWLLYICLVAVKSYTLYKISLNSTLLITLCIFDGEILNYVLKRKRCKSSFPSTVFAPRSLGPGQHCAQRQTLLWALLQIYC